MTKLTIHADCGNAPKKLLLRDLNIAFARGDVEAILDCLTEDVRWQIIGEADLRSGKEAVRATLESMKTVVTNELVIHSIVTHGVDGVVNGVMNFEQGGSLAFCDVYRFSSAAGKKIKSMMSYVVDLKSGD